MVSVVLQKFPDGLQVHPHCWKQPALNTCFRDCWGVLSTTTHQLGTCSHKPSLSDMYAWLGKLFPHWPLKSFSLHSCTTVSLHRLHRKTWYQKLQPQKGNSLLSCFTNKTSKQWKNNKQKNQGNILCSGVGRQPSSSSPPGSISSARRNQTGLTVKMTSFGYLSKNGSLHSTGFLL